MMLAQGRQPETATFDGLMKNVRLLDISLDVPNLSGAMTNSFLLQRISTHSASEVDGPCLLKLLWSWDRQLRETEDAVDSFPEAAASACARHYSRQCNLALCDEQHISIRTNKDILSIVSMILEGVSKEHLLQQLAADRNSISEGEEVSQAFFDNAVNLAARLVSMARIGRYCCATMADRPLLWLKGPLEEFIKAQFVSPAIHPQRIKLGKNFNARNLQRIGGFRFDWTDNLLDHLRVYDLDERRVAVFHYASFLKCSQK
jgi:hypothetical protein